MLGNIEGRRERGRQDEMIGWHHQFSRHGFEQAPGHNGVQGDLECSSPWGHKNWTRLSN